jgi:hypothetical protein
MQLGWRMRYYPAVGPAIPRASVGRSRVTHPFAGHPLRGAHDLHVLSTPPAFVLSQDQTLQEKSSKQLFRTPLPASTAAEATANPGSCVKNHRLIVGQTLPGIPTWTPDQQVRPARLRSRVSVVKQQCLINTFGAAFSGSLTTYLGFASKSTAPAGDFREATPATNPH